jgi:uncharacterized protein (TIGR02757 family)
MSKKTKSLFTESDLIELLESKTKQYNLPSFIEADPISIPHLFSRKEDIEIAGFLSATIAWGQRPVIIRNARKWMQLMSDEPYDFMLHASEKEIQKLRPFVHRTFNGTDAVFFIKSLRNIYKKHDGLESVFQKGLEKSKNELLPMKGAIVYFRSIFLEVKHESRSEKHIANPASGSNAKRINMFLRWMIRNNQTGVDFGIWQNISPTEVLCPLDVHVGNTARALGLIAREQDDWKTVEELNMRLRDFDPKDPSKYDFALFGLGIFEGFGRK